MKEITLYEHQLGMVKAAEEHAKGIIQSPTGSGKTFAQAGVVNDVIHDGGFKVVVVKTPRILLSNQVSKEYNIYLRSKGLRKTYDFNSVLIHSGDAVELPDEDLTDVEYFELIGQLSDATTSTQTLEDMLTRSREKDLPFIIYTTYHSTEKVVSVLRRMELEVELDINDEAHYLVREDFNTLLDIYEPNRQYFFTATLRLSDSDEGRGMNNAADYGDIIYSLPISEAIEKDLILPIKPVLVRSQNDDVSQERVDEGIGQCVQEAFNGLEKEFSSELGAKLLVATRGAEQIKTFVASDEHAALLDAGVDILTVHSHKELTTYNGEIISRKEFEKIKDRVGNDASKRLIIMHYDILSEGIDVPGLLGVLILRNMGEAKFLQTIGRVVRLYRRNPSLKEHGILFFPDITDKDLVESFKQMLLSIKEEGYTPHEFITEFLTLGDDEEDEEPWFDIDSVSRGREADLRLILEDADLITSVVNLV